MPLNYVYNPRSRRYHEASSGRFVSNGEVRAAVDSIIEIETVKVRDLSQQLVNGQINLAEWQQGMLGILKPLHVALALAANGGLKNTSPGDLGYIGSLVKEQYKYLQGFVKDIKQGNQKLDGTLVSRSALYVQAARGTHEAVLQRLAQIGGAKEEKSTLASGDSCQDCLTEAGKGWSQIGSLIPIGQRECGPNCKCSMQYR